MKIIKIIATRYHILKLKCTKFDFGWAQTSMRDLTALPDPLAGFKGHTSKGMEGRKEGREGQGSGRER